MTSKLPNLTTPALLAAALVAAAAWAWTDRQRTTSTVPADPRTSAVSADTVGRDARPTGQELLARAIVALENHRSLSAKIRQNGSLFGQETIGSGVYLQQQVEGKQIKDNLLFRLDLRTQIGEETGGLAHVRDDQGYLWTYEKLPGEKAQLSRIDVQRVDTYLEETGQINCLHTVGGWPGLGGLPKLLRSLHRTFDFAAVGETELAGERPLPALKLLGRWKPDRLSQMLPKSQQAAVVDGRVDLAKLPPQLPEQVVLLLGKEDLFPYRIEYRRETVTQPSLEEWPARWFMTIELFEVSFNGPISEGRFKFPTNLDCPNKTDAFLQGLEKDWPPVRRGSPDPADGSTEGLRSAAAVETQETYGRGFRRGQETRAERTANARLSETPR